MSNKIINNPIDQIKVALKDILDKSENWRECSPDHPPCAICKRIISSIGIRLYNENATELSFHFSCVNKQMKQEFIKPISKNELLSNNTDKYLIIECGYCKKFKDCKFLSPEGIKEIEDYLGLRKKSIQKKD